jgi:flavorubredoxin
MQTNIDEIADGLFRISTFVPDAGLAFNQILVAGDEPFLFHTGQRLLFESTSDAVGRVLPVDRLRWIGFAHVEADECGALNQWLGAAPSAEVAFGALGVMVSVNDLADRPPRGLEDGELLDTGGKRLRYIATPHVPHGWESGIFFEETTGTLLCGDLFTQLGDQAPVSHSSPIDGSIAAEEAFGYSSLAPATVSTLERLAELEPTTLALMHGAAYVGDGGRWLRELAAFYAQRIDSAVVAAA